MSIIVDGLSIAIERSIDERSKERKSDITSISIKSISKTYICLTQLYWILYTNSLCQGYFKQWDKKSTTLVRNCYSFSLQERRRKEKKEKK